MGFGLYVDLLHEVEGFSAVLVGGPASDAIAVLSGWTETFWLDGVKLAGT